jgi:hypothetical protein
MKRFIANAPINPLIEPRRMIVEISIITYRIL